MLTLNSRDCILGMKATADGKETPEGEEIKTLGLTLRNIMLDQNEINSLLCEPHAFDVLFNTGVKPIEPYLKSLKVMELKDASEHAFVQIVYGLGQESVTFSDCKISKMKLELRQGGDAAMSCKITAVPALDETLAELFEHLGKSVTVEIRANPPGAQQDLPLNTFGEDEQKPKQRPKKNRDATVN